MADPAGPAEPEADGTPEGDVAAADAEATAEAEAAADAAATPVPADERLLSAHDLARAALHEVTAPATVGDPVGYTVEDDGVVSLRFHNKLDGYPGWFWTVSLAVVEDAEPTVLEVELLPGDDALLAPDWVPWAVRLADYHAAQAAQAEAQSDEPDDSESDDDDDDDDELDDIDDLDAVDFDEDGSSILHAGDVDGVDIDELDEDADDSDESDEDVSDDDSDDDDSEDDDSDDDVSQDPGTR